MTPLYPALLLVSVNVAIASLPPRSVSLAPGGPSNTTIGAANSSDQALCDWPDRLPWRFPICMGLKLEIVSYGEYALLSEHDAIQRDLNSIIHDIKTEGDPL